MGSTTKVKVAEIFTQAGAAFSRLGELTMQLQSTAEADGTPKWTDEEIDMLNIAITRFCSDLTEISLRVKQRGVSQLKQTLKKKIYEDAGIAVKQIAIQQQPHRSGTGPPPIVLGAADILATSPQQFAQLQQLQHQQVIQQQQQQQYLQHQPQQQQQLQLHPATSVIQHPLPQQQQSPLLQPQHIFISHIPATAVSSSNNQFQAISQPNLNSGMTTVFAAANQHHQHQQHPTLPIIISHQQQQQPPPAMMMTLNRLNASTPSALMMEPTSLLGSCSGVVVELDDDDDDDDGGDNGDANDDEDDAEDDDDDDDDADEDEASAATPTSMMTSGEATAATDRTMIGPIGSMPPMLVMSMPGAEDQLMADDEELKGAFGAAICGDAKEHSG